MGDTRERLAKILGPELMANADQVINSICTKERERAKPLAAMALKNQWASVAKELRAMNDNQCCMTMIALNPLLRDIDKHIISLLLEHMED